MPSRCCSPSRCCPTPARATCCCSGRTISPRATCASAPCRSGTRHACSRRTARACAVTRRAACNALRVLPARRRATSAAGRTAGVLGARRVGARAFAAGASGPHHPRRPLGAQTTAAAASPLLRGAGLIGASTRRLCVATRCAALQRGLLRCSMLFCNSVGQPQLHRRLAERDCCAQPWPSAVCTSLRPRHGCRNRIHHSESAT